MIIEAISHTLTDLNARQLYRTAIPMERSPTMIILMNFGWIWNLSTENIPDIMTSPIIRYKPYIEELKAIHNSDPIKAKAIKEKYYL